MRKEETIEFLKAMHCIIKCLSDEGAYYTWIRGYVPDEPTEEDFETIANCKADVEGAIFFFRQILVDYSESGFFADKTTYETLL